MRMRRRLRLLIMLKGPRPDFQLEETGPVVPQSELLCMSCGPSDIERFLGQGM